ncbi:hypothetical protein QZH41_018359, partial [Actinostola sp. cb2023]
ALKSTANPSEPIYALSEPGSILRFIVALCGTGPLESSPILGYQNEFYLTNAPPKELKGLLPEGPLLSTDSYKLRSQALLADQYILYSSDLFEKPPTIAEGTTNSSKRHAMFPHITAPGGGQGRNRFFSIQEMGEALHDKKTRLTVFGALSHGYTDDMEVKLGLPELPSSNEKRDGVTDCPYITEAGPLVLDELYNLVSRQVSYLIKTPTQYNMVSINNLIDHSLDVLIGVPTTIFLIDKHMLTVFAATSVQSPFQLTFTFESLGKQLRFVQQWVFQGICRDVYEEFIIEVDDQFLAYRDKHFWSHGFVMSEKDKLDCVPMFLSELANDIFVCGKSINLMKLCCPGHFLCDSGVPPPKMEVTFSMDKLKAIDKNCLDYVHAMDDIATEIRTKREKERLALEQAKEKVLMEDRARAEDALAEVTGLINQVKEAVDSKKKADLNMLKEQMEEAIKKRKLDKERESEVDNKYIVDALNRAEADDELRERARQELIDYYQKLTDEMDRREERAQWQIKRHKLNRVRIEFLAQEQAELERLLAEASEDRIKVNEEVTSVEKNIVPKGPDSSSTPQPVDKHLVSVPSPSLVSLIASGVKTDALVQSEANKSIHISSSTDSGFIPGTGTLVGITGKYTKDGEGVDVSLRAKLSSRNATTSRQTWETSAGDVNLAESPFAHGHPTDSSIQFSLYGDKQVNTSEADDKSPITWSGAKDVKPDDLKSEHNATSSRKKWETAVGDVNLAESPHPYGHPTDSSIQVSLYGDKQVNTSEADDKSPITWSGAKDVKADDLKSEHNATSSRKKWETAVGDVNLAESPHPHGHPTDSSIQVYLYGDRNVNTSEADEKSSITWSGANDVKPDDLKSEHNATTSRQTWGTASGDVNLAESPHPHGHPTDSSIQVSLYGDKQVNTSEAGEKSSITWSGAKDTKPDDLKSEHNATTSRKSWETATGDVNLAESPHPHGHPTDSSIQVSLYGDKQVNTSEADEKSSITWSGAKDAKPDDLKSEHNATSSRKKMETAVGDVNLADSPHPHGHPTDSSIQVSLYGDRNVNTSETDENSSIINSSSSLQASVPNPSDSSIQGLMYPVNKQLASHEDVLKPECSTEDIGDSIDDVMKLQESSNDSQEQPKVDIVIQDFLHSLSKGVDGIRSPLIGHPSESTMGVYLSGDQTSKGLKVTPVSSYGHPTQSSAQSLLYPSDDFPARPHHGPRSTFGHPTDSTAQSVLYVGQEDPTACGIPQFEEVHHLESIAHDKFVGDETLIPSGHRSRYGHPSDSQFSSTRDTPNQNILAYQSRSHWGHPSDSRVEKLLVDTCISTLSESQNSAQGSAPTPTPVSLVQDPLYPENTRGAPPADSVKDIMYPVGGSASPGKIKRSTRGHEPAVKITKLMYPAEQEKETAPEPAKPLEFEDVWIASEVEPLQVDFDILDKRPTNDLLKSALSNVAIGRDDDDDDDDIDAARLMSLPVLLRRSVTAPLMAQILDFDSEDDSGDCDVEDQDHSNDCDGDVEDQDHDELRKISLVNSMVVEYFMDDLKISRHFEIFRKFLFMEDGEFALSLSDQLFQKKKETTKHHDQMISVQNTFVKEVKALIDAVEELGNPFREDSGGLLVLDTKDIMPKEVVDSVKNIEKLGHDQYTTFVKERFVDQKKPITDPIKRNKLWMFSRPPAKAPSKKQAQVTALKEDCVLFSRLYIACQSREGDLHDFFKHENQPCPPSLSQQGQLRQGNKADLVKCLTGTTEVVECPQVDAKVIDGAVIVQMLNPKTASTFREYVATVFIPYVISQLRSAQRIDIAWDTYKDDSLKSGTRDRRGSGARRRVALSVKIPPNWKSFLRVNENKTELFRLLAEEVIDIDAQGKEVYSTYGNEVLSNTARAALDGLQPCNHEEADSRIFLHVHDAALQHRRILIRSVDTDVFVLAVAQMQRIPDKELWLAFGTGKQFRYFPIHVIARSLGPQRSLALPVFHALTGCDTVSFFGGKSKKSAWDTWNAFPEVTRSFLEIATAPDELSNNCTQTIERFVVLLYDRGSQLSSVDDARQQLFCKRSRSLDRIPPTSAALRQHLLRAAYQGGHVWSQVHVALPELPSPSEWGWEKDEFWRPVWTTLPQAQQSCYELIHCSCKKACRGLCKCLLVHAASKESGLGSKRDLVSFKAHR